MTATDFLTFLLAYWGSLIALLAMFVATAFFLSRFLFTFCAVVAVAFTLKQRGCHQSLHELGRATGGAPGDAPPLLGSEFLVILVWTAVLFGLNARFRKNARFHKNPPNSLR